MEICLKISFFIILKEDFRPGIFLKSIKSFKNLVKRSLKEICTQGSSMIKCGLLRISSAALRALAADLAGVQGGRLPARAYETKPRVHKVSKRSLRHLWLWLISVSSPVAMGTEGQKLFSGERTVIFSGWIQLGKNFYFLFFIFCKQHL